MTEFLSLDPTFWDIGLKSVKIFESINNLMAIK
jgi:hypothetical protein